MILKIKQNGSICFVEITDPFEIFTDKIKVLKGDSMTETPLTKPHEISVYVEGKLIEHIDSNDKQEGLQ